MTDDTMKRRREHLRPPLYKWQLDAIAREEEAAARLLSGTPTHWKRAGDPRGTLRVPNLSTVRVHPGLGLVVSVKGYVNGEEDAGLACTQCPLADLRVVEDVDAPSDAELFNRAVPVGSRVLYLNDQGKQVESFTRSEAWLAGDGTPLVKLGFMAGGYSLARVYSPRWRRPPADVEASDLVSETADRLRRLVEPLRASGADVSVIYDVATMELRVLVNPRRDPPSHEEDPDA